MSFLPCHGKAQVILFGQSRFFKRWVQIYKIHGGKTGWLSTQNYDGGWSYNRAGKGPNNGTSYGSVTVAGISSVLICLWLLKQDWKDNESVRKAIKWLDRNFDIKRNPNYRGLHNNFAHNTVDQ